MIKSPPFSQQPSFGDSPASRLSLSGALRLLVLAATFSAAAAHADNYADVNVLIRAGKLTEALAKADQYLAGKPRDPQMRFIKGVIQSEAAKPVDAIATFTHLLETLLDQLRSGTRTVTKPAIALLLGSVDVVRALIVQDRCNLCPGRKPV